MNREEKVCVCEREEIIMSIDMQARPFAPLQR